MHALRNREYRKRLKNLHGRDAAAQRPLQSIFYQDKFWDAKSLKGADRFTFAAAKMRGEIIPGLIESIRKAISERREYGKGKKAAHGSGGKARV